MKSILVIGAAGFTPKTALREGLRKFAEWYKEYYFSK